MTTDPTTLEPKLLPCPFFHDPEDGELMPEVIDEGDGWRVECPCGIRGRKSMRKKSVVNEWNTRATPPESEAPSIPNFDLRELLESVVAAGVMAATVSDYARRKEQEWEYEVSHGVHESLIPIVLNLSKKLDPKKWDEIRAAMHSTEGKEA